MPQDKKRRFYLVVMNKMYIFAENTIKQWQF